ncbi:hypothetical protein HJB96_32740 [Rhizobium sp. NLR15a]|uniref:hypothetical protein n=1 Tax=Rhizobium sp. NLR15a TaxID=2731111 RepID=UPI001C838274|nr:hypothetical protein [Rhizobium sp. NLR15a]MBX5297599.1 hypothetical protein [Rhizobium sp. NLR15a]
MAERNIGTGIALQMKRRFLIPLIKGCSVGVNGPIPSTLLRDFCFNRFLALTPHKVSEGALVHGWAAGRDSVFDGARHFVVTLHRTDFGRAHASVR